MRVRVLSFVAAAVFLISGMAGAQILFTASMNGSQEGATDSSHGQGTAWAMLSADMKTLTYRVTYAHLDSTFTASHFHVGAPGVAGPVVQPITFTGNTGSGTWSDMPDTLVTALLRGRIYVNVHSRRYPGGEIRGQLLMAPGTGFTISMSDSQETPGTGTGATGTGWAVLDSMGGSLRFRATIAGMSDTVTAAHFHQAPAGVAGPVIHPVAFADSTTDSTWAGFADSTLLGLVRGNIYLNAHTKNHPGGEVRGQLLLVGTIHLIASLDGSQETPPDSSKAQATAWGVLSNDLSTLTYRLTYAHLDTTFTASHFHVGAPGVAGPVVHPITFTGNTGSGTWSNIPDSLLIALFKGNIYANVHSKSHPAGEIRGAVKIAQGIGFTISMDANQETPGTGTSGTGTGWAVLDSSGSQLTFRATVASLSDSLSAAHFHQAPVGVAGPVIHPVSFNDSTTTGVWTGFADSTLLGLARNDCYLNAHTKAHPAGEIRGQLLYIPGPIINSVEQLPNRIPTAFQLEQNYPNPFNPSTIIQFQMDRAARVTLKVYNLLGQEVATLVNDEKAAGVYQVRFDGAKLASGVYFYRLSTTTGLVQSRKMLLVK